MNEWNRNLSWAQLWENVKEFLGKWERDFMMFSTGFGFGLLAAWLF